MPVRSGGGCVKYLISTKPSLCVRQWMATNSLIRSLSSPCRDISCPNVRLLPDCGCNYVDLILEQYYFSFRALSTHLYLPFPTDLLHAFRPSHIFPFSFRIRSCLSLVSILIFFFHCIQLYLFLIYVRKNWWKLKNPIHYIVIYLLFKKLWYEQFT